LAYHIAMKHPETGERASMLKMIYEEQLLRAMNEDRDRSSLRMVPRQMNIG
jgi:hypothetical protein